jgi:uncharacterized protein (TIGR03437 family)
LDDSRVAQKLILGKVFSILPVSLVALIGVWGSSQSVYAQGRAYVPNFGSDNLTVIDTSNNTVVATVAVGSQPNQVAITPDGTRAYVTNGGGDVWVLATSNNAVLAKVVVGGYPSGIVITPDGTQAYVTKDNANTVAVIATASNTVTATVPVGAAPSGLAITPDGTRVYVANVGVGTGVVSVISTSSNSVVDTVNVGNVGPVGVAITPDGTRAYVLDGLGNLTVIATSTNTVAATVTLAGNEISPFGLAITPDGTRAYVTRFAANSIAVIDTSSNAMVATVALGAFPNGVAIAPDGKHAYVGTSIDATGNGNGNVSVIDTSSNTVVATVGVGSTPYGLAITGGGGGTYTCTNTVAPVIASIDSASAYGGYSYFASGSWLEIKGTNLADPSDPRLTAATNPGQWTASDFSGANAPTTLDGISVSINGKPAYVWYLSPGQLNVQAPEDSASGNVGITVTNCKATSPPFTFTRRALAPGFLAPPNYTANGTQYMVATFVSDGAYVLNTSTGASFGLNSRPAKPGDLIVAYGIGFGDVTPAILPGVIVGQSNSLVNPITLSFGSTNASLMYAGLAGNFVGLYEFYITVPSGLANGDYQINVTQNGAAVPQTMYLTVHN